jgi:hypothetical protein
MSIPIAVIEMPEEFREKSEEKVNCLNYSSYNFRTNFLW